jgi:hypothetical protein
MSDQSNPPEWTKVTLPLPAKHQWKAAPGYQIFVGDAGAVRLEFPQGWVVRNDKKQTISVHDHAPPADTARLSLTVFRLPRMPANWWTELPMEKMMREAMTEAATEAPSPGHPDANAEPLEPMQIQRRGGIEIGWLEKHPWTDPDNGKPIRCRQAMARGRNTQILLTFDTYQEADAKFDPVWNHLLKSLRLEVPVNIDGSGRN